MRGRAAAVVATALLTTVLTSGGPASAGTDVLVGRYDAAGTGANLHETQLSPASVNRSSFGKLFSYELDGFAYAQPLIVSDLPVHGRTRNVVYVATTNSMVYALDADDPGHRGGLLWQVRLTAHGAFPTPSDRLTIQSNVGILSTPVIDRARGTLYVVVRSRESTGRDVHRLHALDLLTGRDRPNSPAEIAPAVYRTPEGDEIPFRPGILFNRPGLALSGSSVVIAWSAQDRDNDDHGWVTAHDAVTLRRTGIFCASCARAVALPCEFAVDCVEPRGRHLIGGGIWQSGRPPAIDGNGHVYYFTGNGWTLGYVGQTPHWYRPACTTGQDKPHGYYGESLLRLDPRQALALVGSWTPSDWCDLERNDTDLGGSGPMLIEVLFADGRARTIAIGGGKQGRLYSIDTTRITGPDMVEGRPSSALAGNFNVADPPATCPQTFHGHEHHVMGGPVYWPRAGTGNSRLYVSVESDCVRGFAVTLPRIVDGPPVTLTSAVIVGHPGAILSLSADGGRPGSGVLWAAFASQTEPTQGATFDTRPGRLAAYDADDLRRELWNSDLAAAGRDTLGHFAKFNPPTVANGRVYVAAFSSPEPYKQSFDSDGLPHTYHAPNSLGHLVVYGLNPPAKPVVRSFAADLVPAILSPLLMF